MEKRNSIFGSIIKTVYSIFPFAVAMYYYTPLMQEKGVSYPMLSAIYASLKIYSGYTEAGVPITLLFHIARFAAMSVTLSILIKALDKFSVLTDMLKLLSSKTVVVYGNSVYANFLSDSLKKRHCIRGTDRFIPHADKYILMYPTDNENLDFYSEHYDSIKDSKVYMLLENTARDNISNANVNVFSVSENTARLYWREFFPEKQERIGIIGFGNVGCNILIYGLQVNIIDPAQHFEYHIWGDSREFLSLHTQMDKMQPDELVFHNNEFYTDMEFMTGLDRIILCGSENENLPILGKLRSYGNIRCPIHIFSPNSEIVNRMFSDEHIKCFGRAEDIATIDMVINRKTVKAAMNQHNEYAKKYGGKPWEELNSFMRYSNISSSDYAFVISKLHNEWGVSPETIAELEHIRWCRYYYINNWKYGEKRNDAECIHNCLIPYSELSEEEKLKDTEAIRQKL